MPDKTDYTRKCQQLDLLINLLEGENKRLREMIVHCNECKYASGKSRMCLKLGYFPIGELDFCSWAERSDT